MKPSDLKSLSELIYKKIRIKTDDDLTVEGEVVTFTDFVESSTGYEQIGFDRGWYIEVFDEMMIKSIEILEPVPIGSNRRGNKV